MMSSVIPARLEFQCGHAALVSLPRVKGESPAQRTDRIAREKSAAQARACDFCPPPMTVVEVAQAVVVVAAKPPVALPVPPVALPVPPVALPVPPVALPVPAVSPVLAVSLPVPPVVLPVPPVAQRVAPAALDVAPVALPVARVAPSADAPKTAVKRVARPRQKSATTTYRFLVRYRTETVIAATDIRDALRQAERLGATEVLAVAAM